MIGDLWKLAFAGDEPRQEQATSNPVVDGDSLLAHLIDAQGAVYSGREHIGRKLIWENLRACPEHPWVQQFVNQRIKGLAGYVPFTAGHGGTLFWALRWQLDLKRPAIFKYFLEPSKSPLMRNRGHSGMPR